DSVNRKGNHLSPSHRKRGQERHEQVHDCEQVGDRRRRAAEAEEDRPEREGEHRHEIERSVHSGVQNSHPLLPAAPTRAAGRHRSIRAMRALFPGMAAYALLLGAARAESPTPASGFAEVRGGRIYYETAGPSAARAVVLIHGGQLDRRMWDAEFAALARRYRV